MSTYVPKQGEVEKSWILIDAEDKVLGRIAAEVSSLLRGKHKPQYTPYLDCGDNVIIINAEKAKVTGQKFTDKKYYRHSGFPGGIKEVAYGDMIAKHPTRALTLAIKGMLPHNRLGRALSTNVRIYAGTDHPHAAQNPVNHTF